MEANGLYSSLVTLLAKVDDERRGRLYGDGMRDDGRRYATIDARVDTLLWWRGGMAGGGLKFPATRRVDEFNLKKFPAKTRGVPQSVRRQYPRILG
jgi:hypothetical protein